MTDVPAGRREQNKQQCRARILRASRQLFSSNGFEQTTMTDVAARAEVSKATLYNYFTSKDSLLMGIAEAALEEIRQLAETERQTEPSALMRLRHVLQAFVLASMLYLALCRKITYLNSFEEGELYQTRLAMLALLEGLVRQAQAQCELRADAGVQDIVDLLMGLYLTTQLQWPQLAQMSREDCLARFDRLFDLTLAGVRI